MSADSITTIVVPCFNEAARLDSNSFLAHAAAHPGDRFIMVDDGSRDETRAILAELAERSNGAIKLLALTKNSGKAEAVRQGFLQALADGRSTYIGFFDADLSTPLNAIAPLRQILQENAQAEAVFGARVNLLGRNVRRSLLRHYIGRFFATSVAVALSLPIYDSQCGAKIFRVTPILDVIFGEPFGTRWIFDVEIIARMIAERRGSDRPPVRDVIVEHPLSVWIDVKGSKVRLLDFPIVAVELMRITWRYRRPWPH